MALVVGAAMLGLAPSGAQNDRTAVVLHVDGAIGPATVDYFSRELEAARQRNAAVVIIRMDTPGGLVTSMREIIRDILASPVPVITYVSPERGAGGECRNLHPLRQPCRRHGARHQRRVRHAGAGRRRRPALRRRDKDEDEDGDDEDKPRQPRNASEAKAIEDAVAYIVSLAELRGRNAEWAEKAVREAASLSSSAALAQENVIDFVATSHRGCARPGRWPAGQRRRHRRSFLRHAGSPLSMSEPDWRTRLLSAITNPTWR
jgi:membrane-bound serine protease (ClpP class)